MMPDRQLLIDHLATRIAAIALPHPVRVAIDGVDAAGKTSLADELAPVLEGFGRQVIRASIDGFHNPAAVRRQRGSLSPEGYFHDSFNYAELIEALLDPLGPAGSLAFRWAVFDFRTDQPVHAPTERADPDAILVFDGVFLLRPEIQAHFDFSVFVRVDFAVSVARAERRDVELFGSVEDVRRRYEQRYVPGQRLYLASARPEQGATVVVNNNDPDRPVIEAER
jgi:uridine kinase